MCGLDGVFVGLIVFGIFLFLEWSGAAHIVGHVVVSDVVLPLSLGLWFVDIIIHVELSSRDKPFIKNVVLGPNRLW
jgi:hypothetical protein